MDLKYDYDALLGLLNTVYKFVAEGKQTEAEINHAMDSLVEANGLQRLVVLLSATELGAKGIISDYVLETLQESGKCMAALINGFCLKRQEEIISGMR